jgi:hypothetical protein
MSLDVDAETPPEEETIALGLPAARRLGEYESHKADTQQF